MYIQDKIDIIKNLIKERSIWLEKEDIENPDGSYTKYHETEILMENILSYLNTHHKDLPLEVILEALHSVGSAANILYDDNGNYAIGEDGVQGVDLDDKSADKNFDGTWFLKREDWKPTIREAINHYFNKEENESHF